MKLSILIIAYNNPTYVRAMVSQLEKYDINIIVIDNCSNFKPLIDYYNQEYKHELIRMSINYGHKVYRLPEIRKIVGDTYFLTDPDISFNSNIPNNWSEILLEISNELKAQKVGFALDINSSDIRNDITYKGHTIKSWESQFWKNKIIHPKYELYAAKIDTTFCLINHKHSSLNIRIAGNFTCKHRPWHTGWENELMEGELDAYRKNNKYTNWLKI